MKYKWPTLEDRMNNRLVSELEALEQLAQVMELSEFGKKRLEKLRKKGLTSCQKGDKMSRRKSE